jgi:hypothetical protein
VAGGRLVDAAGAVTAETAQIALYDPVGDSWAIAVGTLVNTAINQSSILAPDGRVVILGGLMSGLAAPGNIYDPVVDSCVGLATVPLFQNKPGMGAMATRWVASGPQNSFTANDSWHDSFGAIAPPFAYTQASGCPMVMGQDGGLWAVGCRVSHPDGVNDPYLQGLAYIPPTGAAISKNALMTKTPMPYIGQFGVLMADGVTLFMGGGYGPNSTDRSVKKTCQLPIA